MQMVILYYPPFDAADDSEMAYNAVIGLEAYVEDLGHLSAQQFADAWRAVRRKHRTKSWPRIQDFLDQVPDVVAPFKKPPDNGLRASTHEERRMLAEFGFPEMQLVKDGAWPLAEAKRKHALKYGDKVR